MVQACLTLLFQGLLFFGILLLLANALPSPMNRNESGGGSSGYGYNYYGHPEENPNHLDRDANQNSYGVPPLAPLHFPDSGYYYEDPLETSRLMTPRTRDMVDVIGSRGKSRSGYATEYATEFHHSQAPVETPRRRTRRTGSRLRDLSSESQAKLDEIGEPSFFYLNREDGAGSSTPYPTVESPQYQDLYSEVFGSVPQQSENMHNIPDMTAGFTQMNMGEIPIQEDTSLHYDTASRASSPEHQEGQITRVRPTINRQVALKKWKDAHPGLAIPLRLLSTRECASIRVVKHSPRYKIALYLEDRFLRNNNLNIGPPIPEPEGWADHDAFVRLMSKDPVQGVIPKLRETQAFLDNLFAEEHLFSSLKERREICRVQQAQQARLARLAVTSINQQSEEVQLRDLKYRHYTVTHGVLVPIRLMQEDDLASMGLFRGSYYYQVAKHIEEEMFKRADRKDLLGSNPANLPEVKYLLEERLADTYPLPADSYLLLKQDQVQEWFYRFNYMKYKREKSSK